MRKANTGFTLVELMIVVAIVGILAGIAVFMYTDTANEAKASTEVRALFAEFKLRQEQYHVENGEYLSTGSSDGDTHPASPGATEEKASLTPLPTAWDDLRMNPDKVDVYCAYVTIAGAANDGTNIGSKASEFGFTAAPPQDWYYLIAECDLDGDSGTNSFYFARSTVDTVQVQNEGH